MSEAKWCRFGEPSLKTVLQVSDKLELKIFKENSFRLIICRELFFKLKNCFLAEIGGEKSNYKNFANFVLQFCIFGRLLRLNHA